MFQGFGLAKPGYGGLVFDADPGASKNGDCFKSGNK
jgi:hypothetical protein